VGAASAAIVSANAIPARDHHRTSVSPPAGIIRYHDFSIGETAVFQPVHNVIAIIPEAKHLAGTANVVVMIFSWEQMLDLTFDQDRPLDGLRVLSHRYGEYKQSAGPQNTVNFGKGPGVVGYMFENIG
jgi:hypothetical protein